MALWSRADRTLFTKVVYYGPAFGGKTTNLQSLHRITDPRATQPLLSVNTADDRTLFFDLMPFDLGEVLGYQVAMKVYTVPGQVRYDTTRQVVLSGADAVVFVADSSRQREEQNRWSLQNLRMNMRAKGLDPEKVPVLFQFNKQDLPDAMAPDELAKSLGLPAGLPAVATEGTGVLETFISAVRAMLERLIGLADGRIREKFDATQLNRHVDAAFAPLLARQAELPSAGADVESAAVPIVLKNDDLLENSVEAGVTLGEKMTEEASRRIRLEKQAVALRGLSDLLCTVGATFDRTTIADVTLTAAAEILESPIAALTCRKEGKLRIERGHGPRDPLIGIELGQALLDRMSRASGPSVVADLRTEVSRSPALPDGTKLRALAAAPVDPERGRTLVVYAREPDGRFTQDDVRFLGTLAGHLAVGLEKARLYEEVARSRDQLQQLVDARTLELRAAIEKMGQMGQVKDRYLGTLADKMKAPLAAIDKATRNLRKPKQSAKAVEEQLDAICSAATKLEEARDGLFSTVGMQVVDRPLEYQETTTQALVKEAVKRSGHNRKEIKVDCPETGVTVDGSLIVRAVANLIENALKFSGEKPAVEVRSKSRQIQLQGARVPGVEISVLDRGRGVALAERERIFAPFERGGDQWESKPEGTGLGLHEARSIAERHGGTLEYAARKGGGSVFKLSIPLRPLVAKRQREMLSA